MEVRVGGGRRVGCRSVSTRAVPAAATTAGSSAARPRPKAPAGASRTATAVPRRRAGSGSASTRSRTGRPRVRQQEAAVPAVGQEPNEHREPDQQDEHGYQRRAVAPAGNQPLAVGLLLVVGRDQQPAEPVQEHAHAAEEREDGEQDPEDDRVDAEMPAEASADAGDLAIGAAAAQRRPDHPRSRSRAGARRRARCTARRVVRIHRPHLILVQALPRALVPRRTRAAGAGLVCHGSILGIAGVLAHPAAPRSDPEVTLSRPGVHP